MVRFSFQPQTPPKPMPQPPTLPAQNQPQKNIKSTSISLCLRAFGGRFGVDLRFVLRLVLVREGGG